MGKSDKGSRQDLVKRYDREVPKDGDRDGGDEDRHDPVPSQASEKPILVVVDESTLTMYMRVVGRNGLECQGDKSWLA